MLMISLSAVKDGNLDKGESYLIFCQITMLSLVFNV